MIEEEKEAVGGVFVFRIGLDPFVLVVHILGIHVWLGGI